MEIVFYIGIVLFFLFGPWVLLWRVNARRKSEHREHDFRLADLTARIFALERTVETLRSATPAPPPPTPEPEVKSAPTPAQEAPPVPPVDVPSPPAAPSEPAPTWVESWVKREPDAPPLAAPPVESTQAAPPPPAFASVHRTSISDRLKSGLSLEETLGTDWLNKIGIAILVLGIAFFLAYQLRTMGPMGKVLVGFVTAGAMLGAGIWFERGDRYRILARAGIGGGWALLFFTTYAMYHVSAAQVLTSQPLDLVLMLIVAAGMVAHTLRYRSQVVTGLAFLLAYLTVTISHSNVYSLSAGGVLAAALVVIVGRMQWFELEAFGILASYLNHFLWLRPIIEPMQGHRHPFPEFKASAAILILYWLIFRISYVLRKPEDSQERISTAAAILNTALLLALFKYQSTHPEWAFWALLAIGALETALGQLPVTRRRRTAVIVLSTLGVVLLIAAFPFRYSGARLSVLWLAEAEALLVIGVWTREVVFRRLGMLGSLLAAGQMIAFDAAEIFGRRMDGADLSPAYRLALVFLVAAAVFYCSSHWLYCRWSELFTTRFDRIVMQRLSYVAALMTAIAAWLAFPEAWTALAWSVLSLALMLAAARLKANDLRYQAHVLAGVVVVRALAINLNAASKVHGFSERLITIAAVSLLLYVTSRWSTSGEDEAARFSLSSLAGSAYTWLGSFLLSLLAWYELRPVGVADAWVVGGLVLLEIGLARKSRDLRLQSYLALISGFARILLVNLDAAGSPGEISPRFYTVVPIALVFFYAYWRLRPVPEELSAIENKLRASSIACWLGTITVALLMRFELEPDWVAPAWAALAFALLAIAWRSQQRVFLHQALLVVFAVLFRAALHNLYQRTYFPASGWEQRWVTVGITVALLLASLPVAFQLRKKSDVLEGHAILRIFRAIAMRPEQLIFFFAIGLLTVLLALEMRHGMVTLSWGVEGLLVFILALWLGERSFRLTGLGLLLLCVGKILVADVWRLNPRDRYLTFIVLGAALLLVSFLYTRNRERLRQYL